MFLGPLVFAALVASVASYDVTFQRCETVVNAAYLKNVQNYAGDLQNFRNFYHGECNFFLRDPGQPSGLGGCCFLLYYKNEAQMRADYVNRVPTAIMCKSLKQC
ncbi:hypothetical protein L596_009300 [Steinernema carpocapsae]|uniref:Saposin B-type domain-containing protein n=1 Tax=Steinernema carpocapsae TaxID=34508 RepID=A0A4U5PG84_STECR|nr:hypothetical protein L596_009300 [Steinernema carpocapsae]